MGDAIDFQSLFLSEKAAIGKLQAAKQLRSSDRREAAAADCQGAAEGGGGIGGPASGNADDADDGEAAVAVDETNKKSTSSRSSATSSSSSPLLVSSPRLVLSSTLSPSPPAFHSPHLYYYSSFLSPSEATWLHEDVLSSSRPWHSLPHSGRQVQQWDFRSSEVPTPAHLSLLADALVSANVFSQDLPPNHVLINQYKSGGGILPHTDGPSYYPLTATVSLCSSALMQFRPRLLPSEIGVATQEVTTEALLAPGSCLVFSDSYYTGMLHSIPPAPLSSPVTASRLCFNAAEEGEVVERGYRMSLTFRHKLGGAEGAE